MDERPMEAMREAIKVIKQADPEFKITLAGNYHPEIQSDLYYLSIPYGHKFPEDVKAERERKGQISTVYTCCAEAFPNTFTFSDPAEATWTALHAIAGGYDGYLRWAVNSWTADPLRDSRFRTWAARRHLQHLSGPPQLDPLRTLSRRYPGLRKNPHPPLGTQRQQAGKTEQGSRHVHPGRLVRNTKIGNRDGQ